MARITDDVLSMDADGVHFDTAQLVDPAIGGTHGAVILHVGGARWALPRGARIAPGKGVFYVLGESGRVHVLVAHQGAVRELVVSLGFAARVRRERFDRP